MGQTLTEIAETLRDADKKMQLIYAFNASGKTRLSREFRELIDPKTQERDDDYRPKVLYYNAFTEDLFYWDNDLTGDAERKLCIQPNAFTKSAFEDLGLDINVITVFQRYTQPNLTPRFNQEYKTTDKDGQEMTVPAFSEVTFSLERGTDTSSGNLKISKGEESNFIWSVFYCLLDQVISTRNVAEVNERETDQFNDLEYVFIDDPVSSLDENHLIQLAVDVADLIKRSDTANGLKFIITTHSPLFFNVLFNELKNKTCYMLKRLEDGTFELTGKNGDSNQSFSYHLYLKQTLEEAIAADKIEKYHFMLLRNLENILQNYDEFANLRELQEIDQTDAEALTAFKERHHLSDEDVENLKTVKMPADRRIQDYRSTYNDIRYWLRGEKTSAEQVESNIDWDDVVFEVDLLKSQEINLDYILELIFEHSKKTKSKSELVGEIRRVVRASIGNRAKESLIVDFINQTNLDELGDKAGVIEAFFAFAQDEQRREAEELITDEELNADAAKRYIATSIKREYASENGTELNSVLPKMSPLNPQYLAKKRDVFQRISAFVEKFKGVGGKI